MPKNSLPLNIKKKCKTKIAEHIIKKINKTKIVKKVNAEVEVKENTNVKTVKKNNAEIKKNATTKSTKKVATGANKNTNTPFTEIAENPDAEVIKNPDAEVIEKVDAKIIKNAKAEVIETADVDIKIVKKREAKITKEEKLHIKQFGQYWTTNPLLLEKICEFIKNNPQEILEPSCGRGDLVLAVKQHYPDATYNLYEIDSNLELKIPSEQIIFADFLETQINKLYTTIVGNPPFVKTRSGNLAIDFVRKCFALLDAGGELIFIVPADFFKLTSASKLITEMMECGTFTDIYHPDVENMFSRASINVIVFRYEKNAALEKRCLYNGEEKRIINNNGILLFAENGQIIKTFGDYFDIYVGLVSGKDEVYKQKFGNAELLTGKEQKEKYILAKQFPTQNKIIDKHLENNKNELLNRQIRKFNEDNWWEWGAPRNITTMEDKANANCIYLHNLTRREEVAFAGKVGYFGGNLLMMVPKPEFWQLGKTLDEVIEKLNDIEFRKNYIYAGRFKIGHKQLWNALF